MSVSSTLSEEMRSANYWSPITTLIKITHSTAPYTVRLADNPDDVVSNGQTFSAYRLKALTPRQSRDPESDVKVLLANIDPTFLCRWFLLMPRTEAPRFTIQRVRLLSPNVIEEEYNDCELVTVNGDDIALDCLCRWESMLSLPASKRMTRYYFPALFRDGY